MYSALTVRRLKPGAYDEWRKAWEWPEEWPEGFGDAYILRNLQDPNEVIAFGFFEGDLDTMRQDPHIREIQQKRFERMAPHVESTGTDGMYEVVEVVKPAVAAGRRR